MNPWQQLIDMTQREPMRPSLRGEVRSRRTEGMNTTETLLHLLEAHGPMGTTELCSATGLTSQQLWGLLKVPRARGQVDFCDRKWALNRQWLPPAVSSAIELLQSLGWTLEAPPASAPRG